MSAIFDRSRRQRLFHTALHVDLVSGFAPELKLGRGQSRIALSDRTVNGFFVDMAAAYLIALETL